jgi:hypothetical protein
MLYRIGVEKENKIMCTQCNSDRQRLATNTQRARTIAAKIAQLAKDKKTRMLSFMANLRGASSIRRAQLRNERTSTITNYTNQIASARREKSQIMADSHRIRKGMRDRHRV